MFELREDAAATHEKGVPDWANDDAVLDALAQLGADSDDDASFWSFAAETLVWLES